MVYWDMLIHTFGCCCHELMNLNIVVCIDCHLGLPTVAVKLDIERHMCGCVDLNMFVIRFLVRILRHISDLYTLHTSHQSMDILKHIFYQYHIRMKVDQKGIGLHSILISRLPNYQQNN